MREKLPEKYNHCRIRSGDYATKDSNGLMGAFIIPGPCHVHLKIISSGPDNGIWEHVSVSVERSKRTPNWREMCFVKGIFWEDEETVVQFHPKKSEYVNTHPFVLHLWKKAGEEYSLPPKICV